jgi:unsaturated rhamnogalacturonyl hydrolase
MNAQIQKERLPDYTVAYEKPKVDSIKSTCKRIMNYWNKTSTQSIIDYGTGTKITDFSKPNKNAGISMGFSSEWAYTHGVELSGYDYLTDITGDTAYFNSNIRFFDFVFNHLNYFRQNAKLYGEKSCGWRSVIYIGALDDCGSMGCSLIKTFIKHKDDRYRSYIDSIAQYISKKQFRLKDGTLARQRPQAESLWADDLYMSVPFLIQMGKLTQKDEYFKDAVKQVIQICDRLYIKDKKLMDHGWNVCSDGYDPHFYWARATGWSLMAMAELLSALPENYSGRDKVLHLYRSLIQGITELQDGSGLWHNMLDKNDTYLETSSSAMFVYAVARGINEGWISHIYGPVALTGWNGVATKVLPNGQVDGTCDGTTFAHDNVYYYHRGKSVYASHGYGPVLYAGAEMIRLLNNTAYEIKSSSNPINCAYHFVIKKK